MTREAVIVAGLRTAVGKARRGSTQNWRSDEMAAAVIKALLAKLPELDPARVDDVVIGCAMPESISAGRWTWRRESAVRQRLF